MSYIGAQPTTGSFPFDQFSGDGSTTAFTLTYAPASPTSIIVAISGVVQNPTLYSIVGTTLTFSPAPPTGTNNISVLYLGLPVQIGTPIPGSTLQLALGSAANPSLTFLGDTNTGIYSPGADTIAFVEGGTEAMRINSSANVGIGTSSPLVKLDVAGNNTGLVSTTANNTLRFTDTDTTTATNQPLGKIEWYSSDTTTLARVGAYILATAQGISGGGNIEFGTATNAGTVTEQMQITGSGELQFNSGYGSVATAYGCRAWVNFDGTGTPAIRASGNVSSITDNGTGDYTVNFTTAMPDANYCGQVSCTAGSAEPRTGAPVVYATGSCRIETGFSAFTNADCDLINVSVFR
jgi:hypothetical protein